MANRIGLTGSPRDYLAAGGVWPDGPFKKDTPATVLVAGTIAASIRDAVAAAGMNTSEASEALGIARTTYYDIVINGKRVPDLHTIVLAERSLHVELWPRG